MYIPNLDIIEQKLFGYFQIVKRVRNEANCWLEIDISVTYYDAMYICSSNLNKRFKNTVTINGLP